MAVRSANITRSELSAATGIASTTLYRKLNGHSPFNVEEIAAIAGFLKVPAVEIVDFGATS